MKPSIKGIWTIGMIAVLAILMMSACIFDDWLNPKRTGAARPTVTIVPDQPSYIGQNLRILVTMTPRQNVDFIRLVTVNGFTGERRLIAEQNKVNQAEFSLNIDLARFAVVVETPFHTEALDKGIWKPAKNAYYELRDSTPPSVALSVMRVDPTTNEHRVVLDIQEPHSQVIAKWIMVNGQRMDIAQEEMIIPLHPGDYTIVGYARNSSHVEGRSSSLTMRVAPPQSSAPPRYDLKTPTNIEAFLNETVFLMVDIEDATSFLRSVEIVHSQGGRRVFNFDPLEMKYALRYSFRATKDETVEVIITNGNGVNAVIRFFITVKDHQAPAIILSSSHSGQVPTDSEVIAQIQAMAFNNERIKEVFFLVNNYTQRSFFPNQTTFSKTDLNHTVTRGLQTLRVVAIDTRGARGYSDQIEIIGTVVDDEPPSVQLFAPPVAYLNVPVNVAFLVWDRDSNIEGSPTLTVDGENLVPTTFDGSFFTASWTPKSLGVKTIRAQAKDTAGNTGFAVGTVEVKDPTGIVKPAIGLLGVEPNPVFLGNSVQITLNITPPQNFPGQRPKSVTIHISPPDASGSHSITPQPLEGGNLYRATYSPTRTGTHIASAEIWWEGSKYTADPIPFMVQSPEPTLDFSITPTETYVGNDITLRLIASPTNPNAQIISAEMFVEGQIVYPSGVDQRSGQKIYHATISTLNYGAGQKTAMARVTDSFGKIQERTAGFRLINPTLRIEGWNIIPDSGGNVSVMDPVSFDAYIANLMPAAVKVNGHVHIVPPDGPEVTVSMLQGIPPNHLKFESAENWVPKVHGNHTLILNVEALIGTATQTDSITRQVQVSRSPLDLTISATPVDIDRIYVGTRFDLVFDVTGVQGNDPVRDLVFSITRNGTVYLPESKPVRQGDTHRYIYSMSPFTESGQYTLHATVTTLVSETTKTRPLAVLDSQIQKRAFRLIQDPNSLVFGQPMQFRLELDNPSQTPLSVNFVLVDENLRKLPKVSPATAVSNDQSNTMFRNLLPFSLTESGTFTVAATVTMVSTPPIVLPTMYGDSFYFMPEPNINIIIDDSKEFLLGYDGLVDVTVTIPTGMEIQTPVLQVTGGGANINPVPHSSDTTSDSVNYYSYRIRPTQNASLVIDATVYETKDFGRVNPVANRSATLTVVPFQPQVLIQGKTTGSNRFVQAKTAEIEMTISQIPEFFEGSFVFEPTLNTFNSVAYPVTSVDPNAEASFSPQTLFNLEGQGVANVSVIARSVGNESFTAQGSAAFDVDLPRINNIRFPSEVLNSKYIMFDQSSISVLFNNNDLLTDRNLIEADLLIFDGTSTKTYRTHPELFSTTIDASATFNNVIFEATGVHTAIVEVYSLNSNPKRLLNRSPIEVFNVFDEGQFIDITYPKLSDIVFVGQPVRPVVRLTNIPEVISVRLNISNATTTIVANGRTTQQATPGYWVLVQDDTKEMPEAGMYEIKATVQSSVLPTLENIADFRVRDGDLQLVKIEKTEDSGAILEVGEGLTFLVEYTFDNPYRQPLTQANITLDATPFVLNVARVGDTVVVPQASTYLYKETWAATPAQEGQHTLTFKGSYGLEAIEDSLKFMVVPKIEIPNAELGNTSVTAGSMINGYIIFSISDSLHQYATSNPQFNLWNYLDGTISFPNCDNITRSSTIVSTGGNWDYIIQITATAREHDGGAGNSRSFNATFNYRIDNRIFNNYKQETYTITNP